MGKTTPIVIDCHGHVLGRVASVVAKNLLLGKKFVLVRCEDMQVCGTLKMRLTQWALFKRKRVLTNPQRGAFHLRSPADMIKRCVRGMLPKNCARGKLALRNLKTFVGCPAPYDKMKKSSIPSAAAIFSFNPTRKRTLMGTLASSVGWKYADIVARDEAIRKDKASKYFAKKQVTLKAVKEAKDKILADEKYKEKVAILKQFGYA
ncbi:60S ribosomal protein L13 [Entamoeba marina]